MAFLEKTILLSVSLAILTGLLVAQRESDNWFPVYVDGKAGYIDRTGKVVLEPKYDGASYFSEGLARVSLGRDTIITEGFNQGFIDETGKVVIQPKWDVVSHFSEGLAAVGFDQTKQKIEIKGRVISYTSASHTWYRWGFIDRNGNVVVENKFSDVSEFRNGIAAANIDPYEPKYGFIDQKGDWVIQPQFEHASQFSEGLALIFTNGRYGYVDRTGKIVIRPKFTQARDFSEGLACVKIGGDVIRPIGMSVSKKRARYAFIDKTGREVIKLKNSSCRSFVEGLASFERFGAYGEGFIDKTGKVVIPPNGMGGQSDFSDGLKFVIRHEGKLGYIDRTGRLVLDLPYGKLDDFYRGLASVCESYDTGAKCGYVDKTGTVIWRPTK